MGFWSLVCSAELFDSRRKGANCPATKGGAWRGWKTMVLKGYALTCLFSKGVVLYSVEVVFGKVQCFIKFSGGLSCRFVDTSCAA